MTPSTPSPSRSVEPELDPRLAQDTLDHIEGLNGLLAAFRLGHRTPEKALRLLDRTADVPRRLRQAAARAALTQP